MSAALLHSDGASGRQKPAAKQFWVLSQFNVWVVIVNPPRGCFVEGLLRRSCYFFWGVGGGNQELLAGSGVRSNSSRQ